MPSLTYQISGGALISGGNRAVQLGTAPEPVSGVLLAFRNIPAQTTTVYMSFLVRPTAIGTGSDSLDIRFSSGTTFLGRMALQPDQAQQYLQIKLPFDGAGGTSSSGAGPYNLTLSSQQTYFVVARITRPVATTFSIEVWVNPPAVYPGSTTLFLSRAGASSASLDNIGLGISSIDTGGPSTSATFDEIRVGYTWSDVVLAGPVPQLVPDLQITQAAKLQWQSQSGKTYQVQTSYDLSTWVNFGSAITGNGTLKTVFDSADQDAKKFYRVQVQ